MVWIAENFALNTLKMNVFRGTKTFYYTTKDIDEFKYTVFCHLCNHNGFNYELSQRNNSSLLHDDNNLNSD